MIPLSTTTVTVTSHTETEPGEGQTAATRASGIRAVIGSPSGTEIAAPGGGTERVDAVLNCDPIAGLAHTDTIVDDQTGLTYEARWVQQRPGMLAHTRAGLVRVKGRVAA